MANYHEARVKLTNTQLNKLKSTGKNKTWAIIRITRKKNSRWRIPKWIIFNNNANNKNKKCDC